MKKIIFIRRYPALVYFILVFALSWGLIVLLGGPKNIPLDPKQSEKILPLLYTLMLLGPVTAGLLLTGLVKGREGFRTLRARLLKWRVGVRWYLAALLTAPVLATAVLLVLLELNPEFRMGIFNSGSKAAVIVTGMITGLFVGLFEEIGWSGFIVPYLRKRYDIVVTGLIVGFLWGGWHFILFWESDSFFGGLPLLILTGRLFFWLPPFRIFMVWLFDRTKSLLIVILSHASLVFTTTVLVPMPLTGMNLLIWLLAWGAFLWLMVLTLYVGGLLKQKSVARKD